MCNLAQIQRIWHLIRSNLRRCTQSPAHSLNLSQIRTSFNQGFPQVKFTKQPPPCMFSSGFSSSFLFSKASTPSPPLFPKCKRKELEVKTYGPLCSSLWIRGKYQKNGLSKFYLLFQNTTMYMSQKHSLLFVLFP